MTNTNDMPGGWSQFSADMTDEQKSIFDTGMKGLTGVIYSPVAAAQQVVAGMNYQFFCNAKEVYPGAGNRSAIVSIFKSLDPSEAPVLTGIQMLDH